MKLLLVVPRFPPDLGGVELHVGHLARGAAHAGHEVTVIAHAGPATSAGVSEVDGARVHRFPVAAGGDHLAASPALWRAVRAWRDKADLVHSHNYHGLPALAAALSMGRGAPLVCTPHYHGTGHSRLRSALHKPYGWVAGRAVMGTASRVICVSDSEARLVRRDFGHVVQRIDVIPNGVTTVERRLPDDGRRIILSAGRLEPYKRVDRLVAAASHLPADWKVVVCGDGPDGPRLAGLVTSLGLEDRVELRGRVTDVELLRLRAAASVLVSFSEQEAFGIAVAEAIGSGTPVVASDIPAHRELMDRAGAAHQLVDSTMPAEQLASLLQRAGPAERRNATWTWDQVIDRTLDLYEDVAQHG